jgi:hypothetical protein
VGVKYVRGAADLRRYASAVHLLPDPPHALLVDDLLECLAGAAAFCPDRKAQEIDLSRALAYLTEAAACLGERLGRPCLVVCTDQAGPDGPRMHYLTSRWLKTALLIRATGASEAPFALSVLNRDAALGGPGPGVEVEYALEAAGLTCKGWRQGAAAGAAAGFAGGAYQQQPYYGGAAGAPWGGGDVQRPPDAFLG